MENFVFYISLPILFTDILPIAYVLRCHHKTFELMAQINIGMQQAITPEVTLRGTQDTGSLGGKYTMESTVLQNTVVHQPAISDQNSVALMMSYAKTHTTLDEKNDTIEQGVVGMANTSDE